MVECWSPKPVVRVRVLVFLSVYYYLRYGITRYVYLSPSSLASWVNAGFLLLELN